MQKLKCLMGCLILLLTTAVRPSAVQQVKASQTEHSPVIEQLDAITAFPTAIWTKTLNFRYIYGNNREVRTGKAGNTYLVSGESCLTLGLDNLNELFPETNRQKRKATVKLSDVRQVPMQRDFQGKFDLDELHKKLQREEQQNQSHLLVRRVY